ncbi:MAG: hypothetical protein K0U93_06015 [Gammaproteobacteria bacterium]|nr:hypothetical protein [Gammaproteobacteria bacterium]
MPCKTKKEEEITFSSADLHKLIDVPAVRTLCIMHLEAIKMPIDFPNDGYDALSGFGGNSQLSL